MELGTGFITVTDHGTMSACRKAYDLTAKGGKYNGKLTPILGLEGYFRDDDCPILAKHGIEKTDQKDPTTGAIVKGYAEYNKYYHLTLHARDQQGYEVLSRVLSRAELTRTERHGSERKPLFNWADLEEIGAANVTITSGCLIGMVQRHLLKNQPDIAIDYYKRLRSLTRPGNFFVEIFPHKTDRYWASGCFFRLEGGIEVKFYPGKKLRVDKGEFTAEEVVRLAEKGESVGRLLAVMNYRKWEEREPATIVSARKVEDFLLNECLPWSPDGDYQKGANHFMRYLAKANGDPILISDDSHFAHPEEKVVQDVRLMSSGGSWRFWGSYHRQSSQEAFEYFSSVMGTSEAEFTGWVENTHEWANGFKGLTFETRKALPTSFYPKDTLQHTMALIKKHGRMNWKNPQYVARLKAEIDLLYKNGTIDLLPYFFIDEEVCSLYEKNGLLTGPGRGSAAGLLLTYLLGITHVEPLKFDLSMERFITIDRIQTGKLPDIDQDLPETGLLTDPETGWLKQRFGNCYARISTDTTLKLKYAIKDTCRAMHGQVPGVIEGLTKKMKNPPQGIDDRDYVFGYKGSDGSWVDGAIEHDPALQDFIKWYPKEWAVVQKLLGLSRNKSLHACGYVIADEPIQNIMPLTKVGDEIATQYTAASVEASGGVKMDFLRVNSLQDISYAIKLIRDRHMGLKPANPNAPGDFEINGKRVPYIRTVPLPDGGLADIWDLPEDTDVFREMCEGKTETVFQFNTPGAQQWLRNFDYQIGYDENGKPKKALNTIEHFSAFTALDRPGPLDYFVKCSCHDSGQHNMLVEFANRAKGLAPIGELPILNKLLPETYGVITYQEQLQKVFQQVGKTTALEANDFRVHISKKQMSKVMKDKEVFMRGAVETLGDEAVAKALWDSMETFGQYGFNKSHAVCYTFIGYACAWLKHHYPLEWWVSVLSHAEKNEINEKFWAFAGHLIDLPDIRLSTDKFEILNERIRAPLWLLQGVGEGAQQELAEGRPFTDIYDLCRKIHSTKLKKAKLVSKQDKKTGEISQSMRNGTSALNRGVIYKLIISGAMDSLFPPDTLLIDMFQMYERAIAETQVEILGKPKKPKILPVDTRFTTINQFTRYQLRKSILPSYSAPILPMLVQRKVDGLVFVEGHARFVYEVYTGEGNEKKMDRLRFANSYLIEAINAPSDNPWPDGQRIYYAAACYVVGARAFSYGPNKEKKALELDLDVEGGRVKTVKWPSKKGLPSEFSEDLKGAIGIAIFNKYSEKSAVLDDFVVVQPPISDEDTGSDEPEGE